MDSFRLNQLANIELKAAEAFHEESLAKYRLAEYTVDDTARELIEQEGDLAFECAEWHLERAKEYSRLRDRARVRELRVRFSG